MTDTTSNIEVIEGALTALSRGDLEGALTRFEDDARWSVAKWLPRTGTHEGKEAIRTYLASVRDRFGGEYKLLHLNVHGTPDHVFAEMTRARGSDAYGPGSEHVLVLFHLVMGRVREAREFSFAAH